MKEYIIELFSVFPESIVTVLIAMMPIGEVRISIPIAIAQFHMNPLLALCYSILGNILAGAFVIFFVEKILQSILAHSQLLDSLWQKYINSIHTKNKDKFEKWGSIILVTFVAIPLPFTGIYTGAVAASIFRIPFNKALPLLSMGAIIAGIVVTLLTVGATHII